MALFLITPAEYCARQNPLGFSGSRSRVATVLLVAYLNEGKLAFNQSVRKCGALPHGSRVS
jgi:hypothetical protein